MRFGGSVDLFELPEVDTFCAYGDITGANPVVLSRGDPGAGREESAATAVRN